MPRDIIFHSKDITAQMLIGASIRIYGHFQPYFVPNQKEDPIILTEDLTKDEFIRLTDEYYHSHRLNSGYGDDLAETNANKRFLLRSVQNGDETLGQEWLDEQKWAMND